MGLARIATPPPPPCSSPGDVSVGPFGRRQGKMAMLRYKRAVPPRLPTGSSMCLGNLVLTSCRAVWRIGVSKVLGGQQHEANIHSVAANPWVRANPRLCVHIIWAKSIVSSMAVDYGPMPANRPAQTTPLWSGLGKRCRFAKPSFNPQYSPYFWRHLGISLCESQ